MCPRDLPVRIAETKAKEQKGIDGLKKKLGVLSEDSRPLVLSYRFTVSAGFFQSC